MNNKLIIPENILYSLIEIGIHNIKEEFEEDIEQANEFLYHLLGGVSFNGYNYYKQAQNLFTRDEGHARSIKITQGYNIDRIGPPNIHILIPTEEGLPVELGQNQGYRGIQQISDSLEKPILTQNIEATYQLMITSDNSMEVIIIYHVLRALFISLQQHLELMGLYNVRYGGADLILSPELVPQHIFHRSLNVSFQYEVYAPQSTAEKICKRLFVKGEISPDLIHSNTE